MTLHDPFAVAANAAATDTSLIATVVEGRHPSLDGRCRLVWQRADGSEGEGWALSLRGLAPQPGDRVLATLPANGAEPVVTGVIDSLRAARPDLSERGPTLALDHGEALRISGPDGTTWLEVGPDPAGGGPRLRFLVPAEGLELAGVLRLAADAVEIAARRGEIRMTAHGDIKAKGETIRLN